MPRPTATCRITLPALYLGALRLRHQRALCYFCVYSLPGSACLRTYFIQSFFLWYSTTQVVVVILLEVPNILRSLSCMHTLCSPSLTCLTSSGTFTPLMAQKSVLSSDPVLVPLCAMLQRCWPALLSPGWT